MCFAYEGINSFAFDIYDTDYYCGFFHLLIKNASSCSFYVIDR